MKKDLIDRLADYLITGVVAIIICTFIGYLIYNFRVTLNIALVFLSIIAIGFIVYEGINYIYKKWLRK